MHNNYHFLEKLISPLAEKLVGQQLMSCFSQQKDELILVFSNSSPQFFIKAHLLPDFSCLSFPAEFHRTKRNSIELFSSPLGLKVVSVEMVKNDRSFWIVFENNYRLLFKMHGNRSNIVLFKDDELISLFKNSLVQDKTLDPLQQDRNLNQSFTAFEESGYRHQAIFPTFGKAVEQYLFRLGYERMSPTSQWECLSLVKKELDKANEFFLINTDTEIKLSLISENETDTKFTDPIAAINAFFHTYSRENQFRKEKKQQLKIYEKRLSQVQNYLTKTQSKLKEIAENPSYHHIADIIMANMHLIDPNAERVRLLNFYTNQEIEIKLKKGEKPQKTAENYYRKAKNQKKEIDQLQQSLDLKKAELADLQKQLQALHESDSVADIKQLKKEKSGNKGDVKLSTENKPYKRFSYQGFEIWVGKNAKANDELSFKHSFKDDLWLHAKDVSGSHVLIKYQSGKNFPKEVIEKAAGLAAYYSKRKTDSLCPVIVTPKKFVRKSKGMPAGLVKVEREEVIMAPPIESLDF